ncbi:hypothetical protein MLD38_011595 [Melastoma candidum]|uniref:Uncharacterized protein n=1 Tax=Melastoma candidum TaxID=119954 RepID=A0ACB9R7P5_9MYRT|nr:hypothetical protein MLD38_011595 [Melastoma candidum]
MNGSNSFGSLPTNSTSAANFGVSLATVLLAQLSLALLPRCFPYSHLLVQLLLSAAVLLGFFGVGGRLRRLLGLRASAPAFVFFSIVYVWAVYFGFARKAVSGAVDVMFNLEVALLIIGLCRILRKDPGRIAPDDSCLNELADGSFSSSETEDRPQVWPSITNDTTIRRIRYCRTCRAYILAFDHHCPAFGNCIGQNNHLLFMVLLWGFMVTEVTFVAIAFKFQNKSGAFHEARSENTIGLDLILGATLFAILQLMWQGIFFLWHLYCVCFNIKTEEWVNWEKYPEFQLVIDTDRDPAPSNPRFTNPYDKGIAENIKQFLWQGGSMTRLM